MNDRLSIPVCIWCKAPCIYSGKHWGTGEQMDRWACGTSIVGGLPEIGEMCKYAAALHKRITELKEGQVRHARTDYDRIQDPAGMIPADEPVFLIRAKDAVSGDAVRAWADLHEAAGGDHEMAQAARRHAILMDAWEEKQVADAPAGSFAKR